MTMNFSACRVKSLKKNSDSVCIARLVGFGMVKIVELEQDSTSWKSSAGVGLAGSELPRKRPKKKKSNADLTGLAGGSGGTTAGDDNPAAVVGEAIGSPGGDAPIGKGTGFRLKRYNQTLVLIPILFQAIVVAVGFSAGLYFIFRAMKHWGLF